MSSFSTNKLKSLMEIAEKNTLGSSASYIPELANIPDNLLSVTIQELGCEAVTLSNMVSPKITLQSTSKLIPLIGLLEEKGPEEVFSWVKVEPSGDDFASVARLDQFGPKASNPMLNAGAITLCSHIPGEDQCESRLAWLQNWINKLFNTELSINNLVLTSERRTGDRNRSLAYLLKSQGNLTKNVEQTLELYFTLCSYEGLPEQFIALPYLLANDGININGVRIISSQTVKYILSIMATCGLYNESGTHMVRTGMPAKSGVSGLIFASCPRKGGIVVASPRVNSKGNSIRGSIILEQISNKFNWHFASP